MVEFPDYSSRMISLTPRHSFLWRANEYNSIGGSTSHHHPVCNVRTCEQPRRGGGSALQPATLPCPTPRSPHNGLSGPRPAAPPAPRQLPAADDPNAAHPCATRHHHHPGVCAFKTENEDGTTTTTGTSCAQFLPGRDMGASVGGTHVPLVFAPYMDHLWRRLVDSVPDLRLLPLAPHLGVRRSRDGAKPARCCNWLLAGSRLRRVRITYFEAGKAGQAFNALFYPDLRFDLPLLGIDLISLGGNKILCVIDFLPLEQDPVYLEKHTHRLAALRNGFLKHCTRMSSRHFDENRFFSKQLIFYRSDRGVQDPLLKIPGGDLFVVYAGYVEEYIRSLYAAVPQEDEQRMQYVQGRQAAYELYNAERDPALKLFTTYFGAEWTKTFSEEFLFPDAHSGQFG